MTYIMKPIGCDPPEIDFIEPFVWKSGAVKVSVYFRADEAVEGCQATAVAQCPCRK